MFVGDVARGGRARWRIENGLFQTLKIRGYNLEHNFGHGKKNLSYNVVLLMLLAFMIDEIIHLKDKLFKKAKACYKRISYLQAAIRKAFEEYVFEDWGQLFEHLIRRRTPKDDSS